MKKNNKIIIPIMVFIAFIGGATWSYLVIRQLNRDASYVNKNLTNFEITENSLSASVSKVYDATVVVSTYKNGNLVSTGTGFVYKQDGTTSYIMTNNHVIAGGDSAKVIFSDGSIADTNILGGETYSDIAVLTVSSANIKLVATLGDSSKLELGDTLFAVGAPLGDAYSGTVTRGIVSGKDRLVAVSFSGSTSDYYMKVLQTDAALNPGNSGGPLCNVNGEVVGVNSLKLTEEKAGNSSAGSYSVEGMGFAIPIEDALYYAGMIESDKKVQRPYIGISMLDITDNYYLWQSGINIPKEVSKGVAILEVVEDSPASNSGLQKGDIITKLDDEEISSVAELRYLLYKHSPGDTVNVTYIRNNKTNTVSVKLEQSK